MIKLRVKDKNYVPLCKKVALTVEQAAAYSGIGMSKIRELSNDENCDFVLWVGRKRMIKRKKFSEFIERSSSL